MNHKLATLFLTGLAAAPLAAQDRATAENSLMFRQGGRVAISYSAIPIAQGETLTRLMQKDEQGAAMRDRFGRFLEQMVGGKLDLATATTIADNELDAGSYKMSFQLDDDVVWSMVISTSDGEQICSIPLDVQKTDSKAEVLTVCAHATDNAAGKGTIDVAFGPLAAQVPFEATAMDGKSAPEGGNTNVASPRVVSTLKHGDAMVQVAYNELQLAGGRSLKQLLSKEGGRARAFYNDNYLPSQLDGSFKTSMPISIGDASLDKGEYGFTFRIDDDLKWHMIVNSGDKQVANVPLPSETDGSAMADRLVVAPRPTNGNAMKGVLMIHYGPLSIELQMAPAKSDKMKKSDG